jgi:peptidoglycan/xylan/chitin deacetylase (PgdA/CDA1 family)
MPDGGCDRSLTMQALPKIIDGLEERRYKFVAVPQLLQM